MNRQEWENKFGGGRKIIIRMWGSSDKAIKFSHWIDDEHFSASDSTMYGSGLVDDSYGDWLVVEEPEPTFKEKSIEDFPLVEVTDSGRQWYKRRYLYTTADGVHYCFSGLNFNIMPWKYMRQIKPVDINELKRLARLV